MAETTITIQPDSTSLYFSLTPKRTKTVTGTYSFSTSSGSITYGPTSTTDSGYSYSNYASSQSKTFTIPQEAVNSLISVKLYATTDSSFASNFSTLSLNGSGVSTASSTTCSVNIPISQISTSTKLFFYAEAIKTFSGSDSVTQGSIVHSGQYYSDAYLNNPVTGGGLYEKVYRTDTYTKTGTSRSGSLTNIYLEIVYGDGGQTGGGDSGDTTTSYGTGSFIGIGDVAREIKDYFIGINNIARKVKEVYIGINGVAKKIYPALTIGKLPVGSIVQLDESGSGGYKDWIVMHHDYYSTGATILMRKQLLGTTKYLAYNGSCGQYSYPYFNQDADNYLTNTWLSARPTEFQNLLIETTIAGRTWSGGTIKTAARKVWLPSAVNLSQASFPLGTETAYHDDPSGAFAYFLANDTDANRIAYDENGTAQVWWTRTTTGGTHPYCRRMTTSGGFSNQNYYYTGYLRPTINISSSNYVEEISNGVYHIMSLGGGGQANLISFTVDGTTYQAENGMTWGAWINSEYNIDGFILKGASYVYKNDNYYVSYSSTSNHNCSVSEIIEAGHAYALHEEMGTAPE